MSILSRIGRWIRNERSLSTSPPQWGVRWLPIYEAGTTLTVDEALRVSVVWACMDALVRSIAPRPWNVIEIKGDKRSVRRDDRLAYILNTRPNPEMTAISLREALQYSAIAWGNGYAEIVRDGAGRVVELWPIEPERVLPWRNEDGALGYRISQYTGGQVWVPANRIYHVRGPASPNGVAGDNLLVRASRAIAICASAQQFSASWMRNGGIASGIIEGDGKITDPKVVENLRQQFAERYGGPQNAGMPLVLTQGLHWKEIQSDPNKAQLLETRKFQVVEIARYFGVPLHKLQVIEGSHGYGTNIEQLGIEFVRDTLRPWAERFEQEADFKLISERQPCETKIDFSELTMGDLKSQVEATGMAVEKGLLTINEGRERFGWNHIGPDGDIHMVSSSVKTLEQLIEPPAPPVPALPPGKTAAKDDAEDPEETDSAESGDGEMMNQALGLVFSGALERYARALKNRRADIAKRAPEKAEANLAQARTQLLARLSEDCADAMALVGATVELAPFAAAVEQGEPSNLAARRVLDALHAASAASPTMEAA